MDASNRSCCTRISANMAAVVPNWAKSAYNFLSPALSKVSALSTKYLIPNVNNTVKSKVLPFSASSDLQRKQKNTRRDIVRLKGLLTATQKQKNSLEKKIPADYRPDLQRKNSPNSNINTHKTINELEKIENMSTKLEKKLEFAEAYDTHLNTLWKSEVASRLAGYVGLVAAEAFAMSEMLPIGFVISMDLIPQEFLTYIPNPTSFAVTQCVQAVAISMQVKGAFKLQEAALKNTCIHEARKRILSATASVFCMIAMHNLKQTMCLETSTLPKWGCPRPPMLLTNSTSNSSVF